MSYVLHEEFASNVTTKIRRLNQAFLKSLPL